MTTAPLLASASAPLHIAVAFPALGTARMVVAGEVDLATAPTFGLRLFTLLQGHRLVVLEVDMADVTFLDCAGVSVLVSVRHAARQAGCQLWVTRPQPLVEMVLEMVGLLEVLTVAPVFLPPPAPVAPLFAPAPARTGGMAFKPAA